MFAAARLLFKGLAEKRVLSKTPEQIHQIRRSRLNRLVTYAKERSPFYAELYRDVDPKHFELGKLPVVTKPMMMENFDRFLMDRSLKYA